MFVKVKWLRDVQGHGKKGEEETVEDQYAADMEACGACEFVEPNPRLPVTGDVKAAARTGHMKKG